MATAAAIDDALSLPSDVRRERAATLRSAIRGHDLRAWFGALLADIEARAPMVPSNSR